MREQIWQISGAIFQQYSDADQKYFDQLLPFEGLDPQDSRDEMEIVPSVSPNTIEVRAQSEIILEEMPLLEADEMAAIKLLKDRGRIADDFDPSKQILKPVQ